MGWEGLSRYTRWNYHPAPGGSAEMQALLLEIRSQYQAILKEELPQRPRKERTLLRRIFLGYCALIPGIVRDINKLKIYIIFLDIAAALRSLHELNTKLNLAPQPQMERLRTILQGVYLFFLASPQRGKDVQYIVTEFRLQDEFKKLGFDVYKVGGIVACLRLLREQAKDKKAIALEQLWKQLEIKVEAADPVLKALSYRSAFFRGEDPHLAERLSSD